jgi:hypothetical protein
LLISDGAGFQSRLEQKIELLPENPARERFLDRSELARLLRGIPNRQIRKAALVAAFTGLRRGELAKLRPINVQGDLIYLHLRTPSNGLRLESAFMTLGIQQLVFSSRPALTCTALGQSLDMLTSGLLGGTPIWPWTTCGQR